MLIPDNIHPEQTIYFNGAIVLEELTKVVSSEISELFVNIQSTKKMSLPVFLLSLDWLYLINVIVVEDEGIVKLCS